MTNCDSPTGPDAPPVPDLPAEANSSGTSIHSGEVAGMMEAASPTAPAPTPAGTMKPGDAVEAEDHGEAEAEAEAEDEYEEPEPEDPFLEIREELAAAGAESRRTARRQMEILKEFGTSISAVGNMVRDFHTATRTTAPTAASASDSEALLLPLIEMADRLTRAATAFRTPPATPSTWWPGARAALAPWQAAWDSQKDAHFILSSHMDTLLTRAGLERITAAGTAFDPATMTAVEVHTDASLPDHTVLAELLSGWRLTSNRRVIRTAHVKVSRLP